MKQVIYVEYNKHIEIDKEYFPANITFHFSDNSNVTKKFETDNEMFDYYEMLESRYNLIDLSKDF